MSADTSDTGDNTGTSANAMVIIGASLAGAKAAQALREEGWDGPIELIGNELDLPYERPPLSKGYLQGKEPRDKAFVHDGAWYVENQISLRLGRTAAAFDRKQHVVHLDDGTEVPYAKLLLTTGSTPKHLPIPGGDAPNLSYFRTLEDSERTRAQLIPGSRLVIIGAGWIGLEVAAAAREQDVEVTVLEAAAQPLLRALGPDVGALFAHLHRTHGVDLRLNTNVDSFTLEEKDGVEVASRVRLTDGTEIEADHFLIAVGISPNTKLAEAAGLEVNDGIVVDQTLRTADPDVFAAGDVARAWHPFYEQPIRVEHWANALNQPKVAAASMLGADQEYTRLPYFFSDQYDLGMEFVGHVPHEGYDQVVFRGDPDSGTYVAFWLSADRRILAGMNVNVWDVVDEVRALILGRAEIDVARLKDPGVPLAEVAA